MADDVVDTIAQYDLDDDFPDYANEQNKELNQIVRINSIIKHNLNVFCMSNDHLPNGLLKSWRKSNEQNGCHL